MIHSAALLLQLRVRKLPFVSNPDQAILDWHIARTSNGALKDHDEDLDDNREDGSDHIRPNQRLVKRKAVSLNVNLLANTYLYETERQLSRKRKLSLSFDESNLGRENTLSCIIDSHEADLTAWLLPQVTSSTPFARYFIRIRQMRPGSLPKRTRPSNSLILSELPALEHFRLKH